MTRRTKTAAPLEVYQLKITLKGSKPPIWRRVLVPPGITLEQLHSIIQAAFGWHECHLHEFRSRGQTYGPRNAEIDSYGLEPALDERQARLASVMALTGGKLDYNYDFGDDWRHSIALEKTLSPAPALSFPVCIAGKGRCPLEDCGGIWGFRDLIEVLSNPDHPEHSKMLAWAGGPIDPNEFSVAEANDRLQFVRRRSQRG